MKQSLASEHFIFYNEHGHLEIEGLLSEQAVADFQEALQTMSPLSFAKGRDLWRHHEAIRRVVLSKKYGSIAAQLFREKQLRIAYDQAFETDQLSPGLFESPTNLKQMSCFQGLVGGLIIRLSEGESVPSDDETLCPVPEQKGSGIFFSYKTALDLNPLIQLPSQLFFLIAYGPVNTLYIHNPKDPNLNLLKKEGFVFGERLRDDRHPVLKLSS